MKHQYQSNYSKQRSQQTVRTQSEFQAITDNVLKAREKGREKSRVQGAIGFGFASHWLNNWREIFSKSLSVTITFDSHLKTALLKHLQKRPWKTCSTTHRVSCKIRCIINGKKGRVLPEKSWM